MAITITREDIKRKCMIPSSETAYDNDIDALIAEAQPGIEYGISDEYLNDTENQKLQAALKLGILEILSGEFLQQLYREMGASESFKVGSITIGARRDHGMTLIQQGAARLLPFRKQFDDQESDQSEISMTTSDKREFTKDGMRVW